MQIKIANADVDWPSKKNECTIGDKYMLPIFLPLEVNKSSSEGRDEDEKEEEKEKGNRPGGGQLGVLIAPWILRRAGVAPGHLLSPLWEDCRLESGGGGGT